MIDFVLLGTLEIDEKFKGKLPKLKLFTNPGNFNTSFLISYKCKGKSQNTIISDKASDFINNSPDILGRIHHVVIHLFDNLKEKTNGSKR